MRYATPTACSDCVNVHGDDPALWLKRWPLGADWQPRFKSHLCDGCYDDRADLELIEPDPYDMPPYAGGDW